MNSLIANERRGERGAHRKNAHRSPFTSSLLSSPRMQYTTSSTHLLVQKEQIMAVTDSSF